MIAEHLVVFDIYQLHNLCQICTLAKHTNCWYGSNNLGSHTSLRLGPCVVVASGLDPGHWFYVYTENRALGDIVLCKILSIACNA